MSGFREKIIGASSSQSDMQKILCVGRICLDIVHTCQNFPLEDSTERSVDYRWQRGGNASNTCTVLSLIGQLCELLACLSLEEHISFLENDLHKYNIDYSHCPMINGIGCPVSTIILSLDTETRTIIYHNQNLPELTLKNFEQLNLEEYSWIHFEGRNIDEMLLMIQHIENYNNSLNDIHDHSTKNRVPITISIELENPRSGPRLFEILPHADVVFVAKDYAKNQHLYNMSDVIQTFGQDSKFRGTVICAWAEQGAMACTPHGEIVRSLAYPPEKVIDTLGAGDTFNAAALYYLNKSKIECMRKYKENAAWTNNINEMKGDNSDDIVTGHIIKENFNIESSKYIQMEFINETILKGAIKFACRVAGAKVGLRGYDGLNEISAKCID